MTPALVNSENGRKPCPECGDRATEIIRSGGRLVGPALKCLYCDHEWVEEPDEEQGENNGLGALAGGEF